MNKKLDYNQEINNKFMEIYIYKKKNNYIKLIILITLILILLFIINYISKCYLMGAGFFYC